MDRLTDFLSRTYNQAANALDDAKDAFVMGALDVAGPAAGAVTNAAVATGYGAAVCVPLGTIFGGLMGDPVMGATLGAVFTPLAGIPMGICMNMNDVANGRSLGDKVENAIWSARSQYAQNRLLY